jgi:glycosyltransferase involved in cell wall biosynthesis
LGLPGKGILIIVENLPVPFDRRVWNEATALKRAGYRVCVISPTGKGYMRREEVIDGVTIYRHPLPTEGSGVLSYALEYTVALFWETVLAWKALARHGFDAIHACNPPDTIFLVGWMFKLLGKRFVFDHHDINPELYLAKFGRKDLFYGLMVFLERLTFWSADISIATNRSYRDIALHRGRMRPERVFIVRSGPNLDKLMETAPREALKKGRRFLVGYVGVMGKQEGLSYLLEAASYIVHTKKRTDVQFAIVGGGTEFDTVRAYCRDLGLEHYVDFTGRIPDEDLAAYMSTADVCVNPDVANEMNDKSTMNKIMEYMAFRRPIVQFDLTEGRFSAGEASLYAAKNDPVDLAEKIGELLDDPARRREMGAYGRRRVETELAWEYSEKQLLAAYAALFAGSGRPDRQRA